MTRGPRVIDSGTGPEHGCVEPADLYRWASGRGLVLPESFVTLMDFILRAVKAPADEVAVAGTPSETHLASVREQVLGAALNVLAKCPDQCYDAHGLCSGARIAERIAAQSMRWFDAPEPPLTGPEMTALIDRWLDRPPFPLRFLGAPHGRSRRLRDTGLPANSADLRPSPRPSVATGT